MKSKVLRFILLAICSTCASVAGQSAETAISDTRRACGNIQAILGGNGSDDIRNYPALTQVMTRLAKQEDLDSISADVPMMRQLVAELDKGISTQLVSDRLVAAIHIDRDPTDFDMHSLALLGMHEHYMLGTLLRDFAGQQRKLDVKFSQQAYRAFAIWCAADWMANGSILPVLDNVVKRNKTTLSALMGIPESDAVKLDGELQTVDKAGRLCFKPLCATAIKTDEVIRAAKRNELSENLLNDALKATTAALKQSVESWDDACMRDCNIAWRLRSIVAIRQPDMLARVDDAIAKCEADANVQPAKRWIGEIRSMPTKEFANSGMNVISDPNDPLVKGVPPQ